jgi:AcrR family transcriptional regulator
MVSPVKEPTEGVVVGYGGDRPGAPLPAPPTQARGREKRERIYRATIARFEELGVGETRIEDVVADAGVSWATFFRYFPRKEDVLIEAAARHFHEHVVPAARKGRSDRRLRIRTATERTFAALLEPDDLPPALHTQALLEIFAHPARFGAMVGDDHPSPPVVGLVAELLDEGRRRGEVQSSVDPWAAALTIAAGATFPAAQVAAAGADPGPSVRRALDLMWDGLAAS